MTFCVECGAEGKTYDGLCPRCLQRRRRFVKAPATVDVARCRHCGAVLLDGEWSDIPWERAIPRLLVRDSQVDGRAGTVRFAYDVREEDANNLELAVTARVAVDDVEVVERFRTRVRVRPEVCPSCSRRRGQYYEGILQVRAAGRPLAPDERDLVRRRVEAHVARTRGAFVMKVEEVHGGLDVYLSSNRLAKAVARDLRGELGGRVAPSPKLYGRRDGKEVHRVTYLLRLPAYRVGDVVRLDGDEYEVVEGGARVVLRDLRSGERRRLRKEETDRPTPTAARRFEAVVVAATRGEIQLLDPETNRTVTVPQPPWMEDVPATVDVLKTDEGLYVVRRGEAGKD
jgi:nonsense-mediated mRNA decay protein 3